jgi:hypothetical protein
MEVLPDALNFVVVWAIGGQEVQLDFARQITLQGGVDDITLMNAIVVEDQVQAARLGILATQAVEQVQEQVTGFALPLDPDDHACADIEGASQVALLVFARRGHLLLLTRHHPIQADFGIEMNVHLVLIKDPFPARQRGDQALQLPQTPRFRRFVPGTADRRLGATTPGLDPSQGSAHRRHMNTHARQTHHGCDQQFAGPGRPPPAIKLRRQADDGMQALQIILVKLIVPIVGSAILQSRFAIATEPIDHTPHGGGVHLQHLRRLSGRASMDHIEDHKITQPWTGLPALTQSLTKPLLDAIPNLQDNLFHGNSFRSQVRYLGALVAEFPFFYSHSPGPCS